MPRRSKKPKTKINPFFLFSLTAILGFSLWGLYHKLVHPLDIDYIATGSKRDTMPIKAIKIDENGCYYKPVSCISEPCEAIYVCPPPSATPLAVTTPAPTQVSAQPTQIPYPSPSTTPTPSNQLRSFIAKDSCGELSFAAYSFGCTGPTPNIDLSSCLSFEEAYKRASDACQNYQ